MEAKAQLCFVAKANNEDVQLRFVAAGSVNSVGDSETVTIPYAAAILMCREIQALDFGHTPADAT